MPRLDISSPFPINRGVMNVTSLLPLTTPPPPPADRDKKKEGNCRSISQSSTICFRPDLDCATRDTQALVLIRIARIDNLIVFSIVT